MDNRRFNIEKTDDIKTIMMLTVVLYHSICLWTFGGWHGTAVYTSPFLAYCTSWLNGFMVQTFTFISAYIYAYLRTKGKYTNKNRYIRTRAIRLILPYYIFAMLWVTPFFVGFEGAGFKEITTHYVFALQPDQLWFLWMLFLLSSLFCLVEKRIENANPIVLLLAFCIIYPVGLYGQSRGWNYFQLFSSVRYLVYFYFGLTFDRKEFDFVRRVPVYGWFILYTSLSLIKYYVLSASETAYIRISSSFLTPITSLCGIMMVITFLSRVDFQKMHSIPKIIYQLFKKYSFVVYLLHMQIVLLLNKFLNGQISIPFHVICNFVIAIIVSIALAIILCRISLFRNILGIKGEDSNSVTTCK